MQTVKFVKLSDTAKTPTRGSEKAAGYDLYANFEVADVCHIHPHSIEMIQTGIAMELPENTYGAIYARSGLATKHHLRPANCVGVIDEDYRGEIIVALHNDSPFTQEVRKGDRIAQLVVVPYVSVEFEEVDKLSNTERGTGGFGSTGKN